jgi:hypothetical protein
MTPAWRTAPHERNTTTQSHEHTPASQSSSPPPPSPCASAPAHRCSVCSLRATTGHVVAQLRCSSARRVGHHRRCRVASGGGAAVGRILAGVELTRWLSRRATLLLYSLARSGAAALPCLYCLGTGLAQRRCSGSLPPGGSGPRRRVVVGGSQSRGSTAVARGEAATRPAPGRS